MPDQTHQIERLHKMCGLPVIRCKEAIDQAPDHSAETALLALIEADLVGPDQLDDALVSDEALSRALMRQTIGIAKRMLGRDAASAAGLIPDEFFDPSNLREMGAMIRGYRAINRQRRQREKGRKENPAHFEHDGLPALTLGTFAWEGRDVFPSWAGFQSRGGAYASASSRKKSDGAALVSVAAPDRGDHRLPPTPQQIAAYLYLKEHESAVATAVQKAVSDYIAEQRRLYWGDDPWLKKDKPIQKLVGLNTVHVIPVEKDGCAYVGFELGCEWDEEHGCGVLTHRDRVIEVCHADVSFDESLAESDGGTRLVTK